MKALKVGKTVRLTERQWSILEQLGWGHVTVGLVRILEETAKREGIEQGLKLEARTGPTTGLSRPNGKVPEQF